MPLCLLLGLAAPGLGYYNRCVGGHPLKLPYQVSSEQYDHNPYLIWQSEKPMPKFRHPEMKEFETDSTIRRLEGMRSLGGLLLNELEKVSLMWLFYVGPIR